ncbi:MAG: hypothetical protein ACLQBK_10235 [Candidatus Sulfotelmatobacter sp.]
MNGPRKLVFAVIFLILAAGFAAAASSANIYIAQNAAGANTGADCADAYAVAWFNSSSNWGSNAGQIGPATTVHLCGTFTAPAGASYYLTFRGSGTSGNPITLLFENGTVLTAPYWSGPAVSLNGENYITVNGGTNGTIQATANGTNLANKQDGGTGIWFFNSSNVQIENMTIANLYVHTCTLPISNCTDEGGQNTWGISGLAGTNALIGPNNTVHDMKWCIGDAYTTGNSNIQYFKNTIYSCDHGIVFGDANVGGAADQTTGSTSATCGGGDGNMICQNTIHDGGNWDDYNGGGAPMNHHDGIHTWGNNSSSTYFTIIEGNYVYGNWGYNAGSLIYMNQGLNGVIVDNNLLVISYCPNAGTGMLGFSGAGITGNDGKAYNNTLVNNCGSSCSQGGIVVTTNNNVTLENNIVEVQAGNFISFDSSSTVSAIDYNDYYCLGSGCSWTQGSGCYYVGSFSTWQGCGWDAHGRTANPSLNSSSSPPYQLAGSSSGAWQEGTNLTSLGITSLDSDYPGVGRPSSGAWDMGAYEDSAVDAPAAPTGLSAAVQ